jgi:glyoxylase-like metal-dependent hydrolase (beta-lactamase superfamily II)
MRCLASLIFFCFALQSGWAGSSPLPVEEIAPGVFVHQGVHEEFGDHYHGDIANIGFIIGDDAVAVIDSGGSYLVGLALREAIRARTQKPIRYVINTHVHSDHIFGNAAFEQDNVEFVGHVKLPAAERVIDLGNRQLLLKAWSIAHTDHDLSVMDERTRSWWLGDLLFVDRTPSIDGDVAGWLSVMDALSDTLATRVIPGHGPIVIDNNAALAKQRQYLQTLVKDLRQSIAEGKSMQAAIESAARSERSQWRLFDSANRRNATMLYPKLEWD